ncbi:MAG: winged helix-turn-helix transcriptional regulator [Asgard group archaeon]|nr:winged helix-turn-helix transcriptional regulator [Asgard group archaeon]
MKFHNIISLMVLLLIPISLNPSSQNISYIAATDPTFETSFTPTSIENETLISHNMEVKVLQDYTVKVISTFVVANNDTDPMEYFAFEVRKTISSVFVYDPLGNLDFSWVIGDPYINLINVTMRFPLLTEDIYVFTVSYETDDPVYEILEPLEYYELDYVINHPRDSVDFNLEIILPVYHQLIDVEQPAPAYPLPLRLIVEDEVVRVQWSSTNVEYNDTDLYILRFTPSGNPLIPNRNLLPLYIILAFLGGVAISLGSFFLYLKMKVKPEETEIVSSLLSDAEQEVIKAINEDKGVSTQRRICDKTGYSKSKVSQILAKLEEKKVLKRERWGRTNKVTLIGETFKTVGKKAAETEH